MDNNVQFNEPGYEYEAYRPYQTGQESFIYRLIYRLGLAKDKKSADQVLVVLVVVALALAAMIYFKTGGSTVVPVADPLAP